MSLNPECRADTDESAAHFASDLGRTRVPWRARRASGADEQHATAADVLRLFAVKSQRVV